MKRVLVVDDERDVTEALAELLSTTYSVSVAFNGAQALELLLAGGIDAVVLDLMMPVMNGEALMAELEARGLNVPVIFASAAHDLHDRARRSKARDFIAKPFDVEALEKKLLKLLGTGGQGGSPGVGGTGHAGSAGETPEGQDAASLRARSRARRALRGEPRFFN